MKKLYQAISLAINARENCITSKNEEWKDKHEARALQLVKDHMPSGSGIDSGTELDLDKSTSEKLVFTTSYHHMDENGMYDGWTDHTVTVQPSLAFGIDMRISGRDRNGIKEYLYDTFHSALEEEVPEDWRAVTTTAPY